MNQFALDSISYRKTFSALVQAEQGRMCFLNKQKCEQVRVEAVTENPRHTSATTQLANQPVTPEVHTSKSPLKLEGTIIKAPGPSDQSKNKTVSSPQERAFLPPLQTHGSTRNPGHAVKDVNNPNMGVERYGVGQRGERSCAISSSNVNSPVL